MNKSVRVLYGLSDHPLLSNTEVHMFQEDVANNVMPIGGEARNYPDFGVEIEGDQQEECRNILSSISHYSHHRNDEALLSDAMRSISMNLILNGRATFEIIEKETRNISLASFPSLRLMKIPFYFIQFIPKDDQERVGKKINFIPKKQVWEVRLPKKLGGTLKHYFLMIQLSKVKSFISPDWINESAFQDKSYIDVKEYDEIKQKSIYQLTNKWGWLSRDTRTNYKTEYYVLYRTIQFSWAMAVLRDHLLKEINQFFEDISIRAQLNIDGLPRPENLLDAKEALKNKDLSFPEAYKLTYL